MLNVGVRMGMGMCFIDTLLMNVHISSHPFHIHFPYLSLPHPQPLWGSTIGKFASLLQVSHPFMLTSSALFYLHQLSSYFLYFRNLLKARSHWLLVLSLFSWFKCVIHHLKSEVPKVLILEVTLLRPIRTHDLAKVTKNRCCEDQSWI